MASIHPAAMMPSLAFDPTAAAASASSALPSRRCPSQAAWNERASSLPDLFLPADGSPSQGFMPLRTRGVGAGVVLDAERAGASFDAQELMHVLYGGPKKLARRRELQAVIENDPAFRKWDMPFLSRSERMRRAREKAAAAVGHVRRLGLEDPLELMAFFSHIDDLLPTELHRSMFIPTLASQADEEQKARWLTQARRYQIIGTYAQTELGHGSFVRGMETTATFDPESDEFVLHTPTLTSTKWWPGNLGENTTHCILMARLVTGGIDHGVHAFILPLRDVDTYAPLPGRIMGDIGPKVGYESNDNGFLRLDRVRIPRDHMLARFARVTRAGVYERVPGSHAKAAFGTMVFVRSMIVILAARYLAKALTISIRYSAVRRQFPSSDPAAAAQGKETPVLDYQPQQQQLFGLLGAAFAFHFTGSFMRRLYESNQANVAAGDTRLMADLHATSSGLKALTTTITSEGIETCRKCCGGHGYSRFCGISDIWVDYVPAQTYEGDNIVMFLQTARSLIKSFAMVRAGKVSFGADSHSHYMHAAAEAVSSAGSVAAAAMDARSPLRPEQLVSESDPAGATALRGLYAHRAGRMLSQAAEDLALSARAHPQWSKEQHWEVCKVALVNAARAHCMHVLVHNFHMALAALEAKAAHVAPAGAAHPTAAAAAVPASPSAAAAAKAAKAVAAVAAAKAPAAPAAAAPAAAAGTGATPAGPVGTAASASKPQSASLLRVLRRLCLLFTLHWVERDLGDFCVDQFLSASQAQAIRRRALALLAELRPDAVALVDSFDFSDHFLNSALGRFDGDAYACMFEWAQRNPLNAHLWKEGGAATTAAHGPAPGVAEFLIPLLHSDKAKL